MLDSLNVLDNRSALDEEVQALQLRGVQLDGTALGLGGAGAQSDELVAGHIALVDNEVGELLVGLEQLVAGVLGIQHGGGDHGFFLVLSGLTLGALDQPVHAGTLGLTAVTSLPPGHVGERPLGNGLAGAVGSGSSGEEEGRPDALDALAVDGILLGPNLGGAVVDGPLQSVLRLGLLLPILPSAEGDVVQIILVLLGSTLHGNVLQGAQAHDVVLGVQRPPAGGALQAEAELVVDAGITALVHSGVQLDKGDPAALGQNLLGGPLTLHTRHHVGRILGDAVIHDRQIGDGSRHGEEQLELLPGRSGAVIHRTGGDIVGVGQRAITLHTVGGQVHQNRQATRGLALFGQDVGRSGTVFVLFPGQGHRQLRGIAHHIAGDVGTGPQLGPQNLEVDAVRDALARNRSHGDIAATQGHGLDVLLGHAAVKLSSELSKRIVSH